MYRLKAKITRFFYMKKDFLVTVTYLDSLDAPFQRVAKAARYTLQEKDRNLPLDNNFENQTKKRD